MTAYAERPPHPVVFDVAYPERLSRGLIFVKWLLAIPQLIIVYLLLIVAEILTFLGWFAILFTGRYPRSFLEFTSGALRWQANVLAYVLLLRDEYPPFSWEPGDYPLLLTIPPAERQSRFRLCIRIIALIPNQIALYFVTVAALFTTFISWWAILITGRYPRGLFKFAVGVGRWYERMYAYLFLLRDEYPPYSVSADARPGNETLSAIAGGPIFAAYIALSLLPFIAAFAGGGSTVHVQQELLASHRLTAFPAAGEAGSLRLTLLDYRDPAFPPAGADVTVRGGYRLVAFRVASEKAGGWPTFFTPYLFSLHDCSGLRYTTDSPATSHGGSLFRVYWRGGGGENDVYFQIPVEAQVCELEYFNFGGGITFAFD